MGQDMVLLPGEVQAWGVASEVLKGLSLVVGRLDPAGCFVLM